MLNAPTRILIFALTLMLSTSQIARAENNLYRSDSKMPFVKMMLGMMSAMGIIDRVPNRGGYGGYGAGFPYSGMTNPYMRALAMRGVSPTALSSMSNPYSSNPFARSPWLQSPLSQTSLSQNGLNPYSPVWGNPDWGVLPIDSYSLGDSGWADHDQYGLQSRRYYQKPYWSRDDIDGWVNEPWENSAWNPDAQALVKSRPPQQKPTAPALVQNFNYNVPVPKPAPAGNQQAGNQQTGGPQGYSVSPLAKLAPPRNSGPSSMQRPSQLSRQRSGLQSVPPAMQQQAARRPSPLSKQSRQNPKNMQAREWANKPVNRIPQKPCVTEFCGLKIPNLDGLWVAQSGEMLGIKNHRYLWSDSKSRYLTGQLKIQNEYLLANVDDHDKLMRFKYKLAGNHLLTMQPDGTVREFVRMSRSQYQRSNLDGYN